MFCHFWQKFENSKWPPFLGRGKFLENYQEDNAQIPCGSKISIFGKNSKIQNGRHFWGGENEIALSRTVKEIEAN